MSINYVLYNLTMLSTSRSIVQLLIQREYLGDLENIKLLPEEELAADFDLFDASFSKIVPSRAGICTGTITTLSEKFYQYLQQPINVLELRAAQKSDSYILYGAKISPPVNGTVTIEYSDISHS